MKSIFRIIFVLILLATGCNDNDNFHPDKQTNRKSENNPENGYKVSDDTLGQGDIFITSGPAGSMEQKQGKIIILGDSGVVMPVILKDDKIMALKLTGDRMYKVNDEGDHVSYKLPDSNITAGNGRMMLLTDDGDLLQVKMFGNKMVVLTKNNVMIPLAKKF